LHVLQATTATYQSKKEGTMKMIKKCWLVPLVVACLLIYQQAGATTIFETTEWILGEEAKYYSFVANQEPLLYEVTLTDFEFNDEGFDFLFLQISTATDFIVFLPEPGMATFGVDLGTTYFISVYGDASSSLQQAGLYGINISTNPVSSNPVPEPATMLLFGSGLAGLAGYRRRKAMKK
jgi:hypothetical protein